MSPIAIESLYHAEAPLGLGLTATVTITEHEPAPPPPSGAEWARELDQPIAELTIILPTRHADLVSAEADRIVDALLVTPPIKVLDEDLRAHWGNRSTTQAGRIAFGRRLSITATAEYLEDAVALLRARAESDLAPLIAHVARRADRLALREQRLAAGRAGRAAPQPIEIDAGTATASMPDHVLDDSEQRFALLEIDNPAPVRRGRAKKAA